MNEAELLEEVAKVEAHLPRTYDELIKQIDRFIFAAQRGFDIWTEVLCLRLDTKAAKNVAHKRAYKLQYNDAEIKNIAVTARKEYAVAHSIDEECALIIVDSYIDVARYNRDKFQERINTFKRIKGENMNTRGQG